MATTVSAKSSRSLRSGCIVLILRANNEPTPSHLAACGDGSNQSNRSIGWLFPVLINRACFGGFLDKSQLETIRVPEAQTLLSERTGVACHVRASLNQAAAPTLQCPGWPPQKQWSLSAAIVTRDRIGESVQIFIF
jgi:hypothetical protein